MWVLLGSFSYLLPIRFTHNETLVLHSRIEDETSPETGSSIRSDRTSADFSYGYRKCVFVRFLNWIHRSSPIGVHCWVGCRVVNNILKTQSNLFQACVCLYDVCSLILTKPGGRWRNFEPLKTISA